MRAIALFVAILQFAFPLHPAARITVVQLEEFLSSKLAAKGSDSEVADALMRVEMAEELTPSTLTRIGRENRLRQKTVEQIRLLAAESVFEAPPSAEWLEGPAPDAATQQRIVSLARSYAATGLRHLPDFLAVRTTTTYGNAPLPSETKSGKPVVRMRFVRQHRREVTYRDGAEVDQRAPGRGVSISGDGLSTRGEFGPTLDMVLQGLEKGTVTWSRWQKGASGARLAVFQYSIPRAASEYLLDLCCFQTTVDDSAGVAIRDRPAYHGEISINPDSGVVERVTVEAELSGDTPVRRCSIAVNYGGVKIDGKLYVCPVGGVAILVFYSPSMERYDHIGIEKFINEIQFDEYHKFGSTSRIVNADH